MPKKLSIKKATTDFDAELAAISLFTSSMGSKGSAADEARVHDYAIIAVYRSFESLMLECLVGALNRDPSHFRARTGVAVPKHMNRSTCQFLITGDGYFDFKGRDGLIKEIKRVVPDTHFLHVTVKDAKYRTSLERLSALRNFAAHGSAQSKRAALGATGMTKMSSAGAYLRVGTRFSSMTDRLVDLSSEIRVAAPF